MFDDELLEGLKTRSDKFSIDIDAVRNIMDQSETIQNLVEQQSITWDGASTPTSGETLGIDPDEIDTSRSYYYKSDDYSQIPDTSEKMDPEDLLRFLRERPSSDRETAQEHQSRVKSLVDFMLEFLAEIDRSTIHLGQFKEDFQVVQEAYAKTQNGKPLTKTEMISLNNIHKRYKNGD
jgi:hypothetical protein